MHRIIAARLTDQHKEGFIDNEGKVYNAARVRDGILQLSDNHGASWVDIEWEKVHFTCARTGRRIRFGREIAEAKLMEAAELYVWLALAMAVGCFAGVILTW